MEALFLDLDGTLFKMQITGWEKENSDGIKWCSVDIQLSSYILYYSIREKELLTSCEVKELQEAIAGLLLGKTRNTVEMEFTEPDLKFVLHPANSNVSTITGELQIAFWNKNVLTANSLHLALGENDLALIEQYLCYVLGCGDNNKLEVMRKTGSLVNLEYTCEPKRNVKVDIYSLKMTTRLRNILHRNDIDDLCELEYISEPDILNFRNMGVSTLQELKRLCELNNVHIHTRQELQDEENGIRFEDSEYRYLFKMGIRCNADLKDVPQDTMAEIKNTHKTVYRKLLALKNNIRV